jgi:hypothetical protein
MPAAINTPDIFRSGRDGEIRTLDLLLPKQALYQAKLRPVDQADERTRSALACQPLVLQSLHLTARDTPLGGSTAKAAVKPK